MGSGRTGCSLSWRTGSLACSVSVRLPGHPGPPRGQDTEGIRHIGVPHGQVPVFGALLASHPAKLRAALLRHMPREIGLARQFVGIVRCRRAMTAAKGTDKGNPLAAHSAREDGRAARGLSPHRPCSIRKSPASNPLTLKSGGPRTRKTHGATPAREGPGA